MSVLSTGGAVSGGHADAFAPLALRPNGGSESEVGVFAFVRRGRPVRVLLLALVIFVMSAADLYITGLYLATIGMAEENPLARLVMSSGSMGYLSLWKMLTNLPTLLLMSADRKRLVIELLGWVACAVLVGVMVRWVQYADETHMLMIALQDLQAGADHRWVMMPG